MIKKISVKIKRLNENAKIPVYGSEHAAGFDLYSSEDAILETGQTKAVHTGISLEIPEGMCCLIWDRSGMGLKGIHRFAGLIDSDYRGEFKIVLCNHSKESFKINKGDRIAQAIIQEYYKAEFQEVEELTDSKRGEGGFGSTGI